MKKKIYEIIRKNVAKRATCNLGKVEITDEEIICYVDGRKIKKKEISIFGYRYNLIFNMINPIKEIYKKYNVNKPVHYIINGVNFDREINIQASIKDCHITFENCTFTTRISIDFADHITFINNKYNPNECFFSLNPPGEFHIVTRNAKSEINRIEIYNEIIGKENIKKSPIIISTDFKKKVNTFKRKIIRLEIYGKEIELINTNIINGEEVDLVADTLILNNSSIVSYGMLLDANEIKSDHSHITTDTIEIHTKNAVDIDITGKYIYLNDMKVNKNDKINEQSLELQKKRLELINSLKKIQSTCEERIAEELKKQPLTRILKKQ